MKPWNVPSFTLLKAYFEGKELEPKQLDKVEEYRDWCANVILGHKISLEYIGFREHVVSFEDELREELGDLISNTDMVELGPGRDPLVDFFIPFGIGSYTAVEPFVAGITQRMINFYLENLNGSDRFISDVVEQDALSYLLDRPDNSSFVFSGGLFDLIYIDNHNYCRFLGKEIYRVTSPGSISLHTGMAGLNAKKRNDYFMQHGFVEHEINKEMPHLMVLIKPE